MRRGAVLAIKGNGAANTRTNDVYALKGVALAFRRVDQQCRQADFGNEKSLVAAPGLRGIFAAALQIALGFYRDSACATPQFGTTNQRTSWL